MHNGGIAKLKKLFLIVFYLFSAIQISHAQATNTISLTNGDSLNLIGIGMHKELRNDIYIGALYAPATITNADQLLNNPVSTRMSLRFVSQYSHRKLARHWKEKMAMNNPREQWQPLTRDIVNFSNLFKRSMQAGDEINLDYIPNKGTLVYLNGTLFTTIEDPAFYSTVLNVWLGNIPPTKAFKKNIRGQLSEVQKQVYISQYENLQPISGRFDADLAAISASMIAATTIAPSTSTNKPIKVAKNDKTKKTTKKTSPKKKEPVKKKKVAKKKEPVKKKETVKKKEATKKKEIVKKKAPVKKKETIKKKDLVKKKETVKKSTVQPKVTDANFFDVDLIAGSYARDLINSIRQYQKYPPKALRANEQGDLLAKITIDKDGELLSIDIIEKSGSRTLDRGAKKIISKAAPFQPIPKELKLKQYQFLVPMSFKL